MTITQVEGKPARRVKNVEYVLSLILIGQSSIPILVGDFYLVVAFLLSAILFFRNQRTIDYGAFLYILAFAVLMGLHGILQEGFDLLTYMGFILRSITAYFSVMVLKDYFVLLFNWWMIRFAVVSLVITSVVLLFPSADSVLYALSAVFDTLSLYEAGRDHIGIYTLQFGATYTLDFYGITVPRNSGPFWEPGGFGVFLNVAIILNLLKGGRFFDNKNKLFIITLLSTQSTGAFLTLGVIALIYILFMTKLRKSIILAPIFVLLVGFAWNSLSFLGQKFEETSESLEASDLRFQRRNRLVSGIVDIETWAQSPIIGRGRFGKVDHTDFRQHRNNGTTNFLVQFGIIGFALYFGAILRSFVLISQPLKYGYILSGMMVIALLVAGMSQMIFSKLFFMTIPFLQFSLKRTSI